MDRDVLLENLLNKVIERFAKQAVSYESEIANLNAEIIVLKEEILNLKNETSTTENIMFHMNTAEDGDKEGNED